MVLCGTWSETSVAQSQLTQFWQIPRHRTLSYSLWTPFFFTTTPSGGTWKYANAPSTNKLGEILYLLICSFLPVLSWLLRSRVRKSRRDLWITLYYTDSGQSLNNLETIVNRGKSIHPHSVWQGQESDACLYWDMLRVCTCDQTLWSLHPASLLVPAALQSILLQ